MSKSSSLFTLLECREYMNVTDSNRSVQATDLVLCDVDAVWTTNYTWIRFPISNETWMPEYCPPMYACNTHAPGWLSGSHPTVEDGIVQRHVCFHWRGQCCKWSIVIFVRNCRQFFVYKPFPVPLCSLRLCVTHGKSLRSSLTVLVVVTVKPLKKLKQFSEKKLLN